MDYADGGDLSIKIRQHQQQKPPKYFKEKTILDWFTQICLAIKHIHDRKILHRDLKSQNIFLTQQGIVKLGDFGIAKCLNQTIDKAKTMVGTPFYLSPEIINNQPYDFKSDIWSLGVLLYEMCALKMPFDAPSLPQLSMRIINGTYDLLSDYYSSELRMLCYKLLDCDSKKRPNISEILENKLIKGRIKSFLGENFYEQEFSHTVLHNANIFNNNFSSNNIAVGANGNQSNRGSRQNSSNNLPKTKNSGKRQVPIKSNINANNGNNNYYKDINAMNNFGIPSKKETPSNNNNNEPSFNKGSNHVINYHYIHNNQNNNNNNAANLNHMVRIINERNSKQNNKIKKENSERYSYKKIPNQNIPEKERPQSTNSNSNVPIVINSSQNSYNSNNNNQHRSSRDYKNEELGKLRDFKRNSKKQLKQNPQQDQIIWMKGMEEYNSNYVNTNNDDNDNGDNKYKKINQMKYEERKEEEDSKEMEMKMKYHCDSILLYDERSVDNLMKKNLEIELGKECLYELSSLIKKFISDDMLYYNFSNLSHVIKNELKKKNLNFNCANTSNNNNCDPVISKIPDIYYLILKNLI